jgi:hypothetical protein
MVMFLLCWEFMWGCWFQYCPFNANVCMSIKDVNFNYNRSVFLHCFILFSCRNVICAHIDCSIEHFGHSRFFQEFFCIHVVRDMGYFTFSKCKVASLFWFAHFCKRVCGNAQLLNYSHLEDNTSLPLIFQVNLIGPGSFSCASLPSIWYNLKHWGLFMPHFFPC